MAESLYCKDQKVTTDKYRERFDGIKWNDKTLETQETLKEVAIGGLIYLDRIDGEGGFIIPLHEGAEFVINECLKNPEYYLRRE